MFELELVLNTLLYIRPNTSKVDLNIEHGLMIILTIPYLKRIPDRKNMKCILFEFTIKQ